MASWLSNNWKNLGLCITTPAAVIAITMACMYGCDRDKCSDVHADLLDRYYKQDCALKVARDSLAVAQNTANTNRAEYDKAVKALAAARDSLNKCEKRCVRKSKNKKVVQKKAQPKPQVVKDTVKVVVYDTVKVNVPAGNSNVTLKKSQNNGTITVKKSPQSENGGNVTLEGSKNNGVIVVGNNNNVVNHVVESAQTAYGWVRVRCVYGERQK